MTKEITESIDDEIIVALGGESRAQKAERERIEKINKEKVKIWRDMK